MKDIVERFLSYTRIDTTSSEDTDVTPSTPNQFILADQLAEELRELGASEVYRDEHAFVYATVRSNLPYETETVGFLAHMDTSNATSGNNIQAAIIENYDGKDIVHANGLVTSVEEYPQIAALKGKSIIITDGSTLLGADDKAGIAIIMDYVQRLAEHPEIPHGDIRICFTPDEEIGLGIEKINLDHFKCDYAFTVDGGEINDVTYENFNAATAVVTVTGNSIHPGSAKGKMINASQVLMDFHSLLPVFDRPEFTEGREGFNHLISINGTCEKAESVYIIRNHDRQQFEKQKQHFKFCERHINEMYGKDICHANVFDTYKNMVEEFQGKMFIIYIAKKAIEMKGYAVTYTPIRGGTDGAKLTFKGVPTPNLGTGGLFCHGNHELLCIEDMKEMVDILENIGSLVSERKHV